MIYSKDWFYQKYIIEYLTQQQIADIIGVSRRTIGNWLIKNNIPRRGKGGYDSNANYRNKNWLHQKYIIERLSTRTIGKICNKDWSCIRRIMIEFGIPLRKRGETIRGKNSNFWKGGKYYGSEGYVYIYKPNHPFVSSNGYVRQHRLIVEKAINRYLTSKEIIHHINEKRNDNKKSNLYLFANQQLHASYHQQTKRGFAPKYLKSNL